MQVKLTDVVAINGLNHTLTGEERGGPSNLQN
jgi:hypothetical protein